MLNNFINMLLFAVIFTFGLSAVRAQEIACNNFQTGKVEFVKTTKRKTLVRDVCRTHQNSQRPNLGGSFAISGQVTTEFDQPLEKATVKLENLTAGTSVTVTTNANGNYSFTDLPAADYRVTPSLVIFPNEYEYSFLPPSATFENLSENKTQNFYGEPAFSIFGHITHQNGVRMSGVTVTLTNKSSNAPPLISVTNENGEYRFDDVFSNGYELRPVLAGYEFFPPAVIFSGLSGHEEWDFVAAGPPPVTPLPPANTPTLAWSSFYNHPSNFADYNAMIERDSQGNLYLGGTSFIDDDGNTDIVISKIDVNGNLVWSRTFNGSANYKDGLRDLAVDANGNVYLAGFSYTLDTASNMQGYDYVTLKYDPNGNLLWSKIYNRNAHYDDFPTSMKTDASGNVYVTGYSWDANVFADYATLKYDTNGNLQWAARYSTAQGEAPNEVEVDASGNVYVTGVHNQSAAGGSEEIVTIKYNSSGAEQWRNHYDPSPENSDEGYEIEIDSAGNVYVLGTTRGENFDPSTTIQKINSADGTNIWAKTYDIEESTDGTYPTEMKLDAAGNIVITGMVNLSGKFYEVDSFVAKFDNAGAFQWKKTYDGANDEDYDGDTKLTLDADGNIFVGLSSEGFFNADIQIIKYFPDGTIDWRHRYGSPFFDYDYLMDYGVNVSQKSMILDQKGNLYVAGESYIPEQGTNLVAYKLEPVSQNRAVPADFDGDGKADVSVYRPETGMWYILKSSDGSFLAVQWGIATDKLVPADFDGDRKTDFGIYRDGVWYVLNSAGGYDIQQFGLAGDKAIPSDFDNDGQSDLSVFRQGVWYSLNSSDNAFRAQQFGAANDLPIPSDYDSNNRSDIAVFRNGQWYVQYQQGLTLGTFQFGINNDKPVPADYDGDGKTDYAVYRNGSWYVWQSYSQSFKSIQWGLESDIPVPADYDGDKKADFAVYRGGSWYILKSSDNSFMGLQFGLPNDIPIASAYNR